MNFATVTLLGSVGMRVFVTGASGFIGAAVVQELLAAKHQVLGLARSEAAAQSLRAMGAQVHRGDLADLESLQQGAKAADAVIHTAFDHNFSEPAQFAVHCEMDRRAITALGKVLAGSERPFVVSAGIGALRPGQVATEEMEVPNDARMPRVSEQAALALLAQKVRVSVVRLPQVHDPHKQGLITYLIQIARAKGVSAYVEAGHNRWAAGHRLDTARLYRLALEKGSAGARYHAVGEEGIAMHDIATQLGQGLKVPVVSQTREAAATHFGAWLGFFAALDMPASSALTQQWLGWRPTQPGLLADLAQGRCY